MIVRTTIETSASIINYLLTSKKFAKEKRERKKQVQSAVVKGQKINKALMEGT